MQKDSTCLSIKLESLKNKSTSARFYQTEHDSDLGSLSYTFIIVIIEPLGFSLAYKFMLIILIYALIVKINMYVCQQVRF